MSNTQSLLGCSAHIISVFSIQCSLNTVQPNTFAKDSTSIPSMYNISWKRFQIIFELFHIANDRNYNSVYWSSVYWIDLNTSLSSWCVLFIGFIRLHWSGFNSCVAIYSSLVSNYYMYILSRTILNHIQWMKSQFLLWFFQWVKLYRPNVFWWMDISIMP